MGYWTVFSVVILLASVSLYFSQTNTGPWKPCFDRHAFQDSEFSLATLTIEDHLAKFFFVLAICESILAVSRQHRKINNWTKSKTHEGSQVWRIFHAKWRHYCFNYCYRLLLWELGIFVCALSQDSSFFWIFSNSTNSAPHSSLFRLSEHTSRSNEEISAFIVSIISSLLLISASNSARDKTDSV